MRLRAELGSVPEVDMVVVGIDDDGAVRWRGKELWSRVARCDGRVPLCIP